LNYFLHCTDVKTVLYLDMSGSTNIQILKIHLPDDIAVSLIQVHDGDNFGDVLKYLAEKNDVKIDETVALFIKDPTGLDIELKNDIPYGAYKPKEIYLKKRELAKTSTLAVNEPSVAKLISKFNYQRTRAVSMRPKQFKMGVSEFPVFVAKEEEPTSPTLPTSPLKSQLSGSDSGSSLAIDTNLKKSGTVPEGHSSGLQKEVSFGSSNALSASSDEMANSADALEKNMGQMAIQPLKSANELGSSGSLHSTGSIHYLYDFLLILTEIGDKNDYLLRHLKSFLPSREIT
jgi:hypothetical protein